MTCGTFSVLDMAIRLVIPLSLIVPASYFLIASWLHSRRLKDHTDFITNMLRRQALHPGRLRKPRMLDDRDYE